MGTSQVSAVASAVFVAFSLAVAASGATIEQTTNDGSGGSSLQNWDVSGAKLGTPTSGNDYVSEKVLRAPTSGNVTFNGNSLSLGKVGGSADSIFVPYGGTYTFANVGLFLNKGRFQWYNSDKSSTIAGTVTVQSPAANPFGFMFAQNAATTNDQLTITATLKGAAGTAVRFYHNADVPSHNGRVLLNPADASEFKGEIILSSNGRQKRAVSCELTNARTFGGKITVEKYCKLAPQYGSSVWTIGSLEYQDGALCGSRSGSGKDGTFTVTDSIKVGKDITWSYASALSAGNGYNVPFIVKKAGATGDLNPQNFKETSVDRVTHECLPRYWFAVTEETNGDESLRFVQPRVIQVKAADSQVFGEADAKHSALADTACIQDGNLPLPENDYVVTKNGFAGQDGKSWQATGWTYTPSDSQGKTYEFPGRSLTIGAGLGMKSTAATFKIDCLRLMGDSSFMPRINQSQTTVLDGTELFVGPAASGQPATINAYGNLKWTVKSALTGDGHLRFAANSGSGNPGATITLAGLSTNFCGKLTVSANSYDGTKLTASVNECVKVSDARQLGGALTAFTADALRLENWGTLEATGDVDFSTANRGVTVGNYGQMRVASGKTLTIGNMVTLNGELHKAGAGTLVFGAAADAGTGARLVVDAGSVQANVATAFAGVDLSFADGTALIVDTTKDFGAKGVDLSGATTPVRIRLGFAADETDHALSSYPLCTVPEGVTVTVSRPRRHFVKMTAKSNGDGTVTCLADVGVTGMSIILR